MSLAEAAAAAAFPDFDLAHPATIIAMRAVFASGYDAAGATGDDRSPQDAADAAIVAGEFTQPAVIAATREVWARGYAAGQVARA